MRDQLVVTDVCVFVYLCVFKELCIFYSIWFREINTNKMIKAQRRSIGQNGKHLQKLRYR